MCAWSGCPGNSGGEEGWDDKPWWPSFSARQARVYRADSINKKPGSRNLFSRFERSSRILKMRGRCDRFLAIYRESQARAPPRWNSGAIGRWLDAGKSIPIDSAGCAVLVDHAEECVEVGEWRAVASQAYRGSQGRKKSAERSQMGVSTNDGRLSRT